MTDLARLAAVESALDNLETENRRLCAIIAAKNVELSELRAKLSAATLYQLNAAQIGKPYTEQDRQAAGQGGIL